MQKGQTSPDLDSHHRSLVAFQDDENYVTCEVQGHISDNFHSDEDDEELSDGELQEHGPKDGANGKSMNLSQATVEDSISSQQSLARPSDGEVGSQSSTSRSRSRDRSSSIEPSTSQLRSNQASKIQSRSQAQSSGKLEQTIELMRDFMIKQGLIGDEMDPEDICNFIREDGGEANRNDNSSRSHERDDEEDRNDMTDRRSKGRRSAGEHEVCQRNLQSTSETTIYKNAMEMGNDKDTSGSTDEMINTSDESMDRGGEKVNQLEKYLEVSTDFVGHSRRRS